MYLNWQNTTNLTAQALCPRGGVAVRMQVQLVSITKDFGDHDPGGSDG